MREVAYDPRYFQRSAELLERSGLTLVEFLAASGPLVDAYQRFYQLAVTGKLAHKDDKVFAAHIAATAARPTERGWKISKLRSPLVIDATVAAVMAVARADITAPPNPGRRSTGWSPDRCTTPSLSRSLSRPSRSTFHSIPRIVRAA